MDKDTNRLYGYCLKPILDKSKNKIFLTQEEFMENYGIIMIAGDHRNKVEAKIKLLESKLLQSEAKIAQLEAKLLKK
jgi:hypothetical protein